METQKALPPGTVVHGPVRDYTVIKVLGQGGFGITYLVESEIMVGNISVTARFAMKEHFISNLCWRNSDNTVVFSQPVADQVKGSLRAFVKEANRLQQLNIHHPNIIKINEVFPALNTAYYVMEYLQGETLYDYVKRVGRLPFGYIDSLFLPIIDAVALLHSKKVTHYDIKPANIVLKNNGSKDITPVLIDFGLAKHYDETGKMTSTLTTAGYSPGYAPVEQYMGLREYSPQSDVYALAATLFFCLTGQTPAPADEFEVNTMPTVLGDLVPSDILQAMMRAMQQRRKDRTADAGVFLAELGHANPKPRYKFGIQREYTPEKINTLKPDEVFVFGSNLAGHHHGGAARVAMDNFGAVWGIGVGLQGQSYAIPTMQGGVNSIRPYVEEFIDFAKSHYWLKFYVTRIGCGIAGFRDEEIAPLFTQATGVKNIILPKSFADLLHA